MSLEKEEGLNKFFASFEIGGMDEKGRSVILTYGGLGDSQKIDTYLGVVDRMIEILQRIKKEHQTK